MLGIGLRNGRGESVVADLSPSLELSIPDDAVRVWSLDDPYLYDLQFELLRDETVIDTDLLSNSVRRQRPGAAQPRNTPAPQTPATQVPPAGTSTLPQAVEALERRMISEELSRNKGNKTRTAEALGISRRITGIGRTVASAAC